MTPFDRRHNKVHVVASSPLLHQQALYRLLLQIKVNLDVRSHAFLGREFRVRGATLARPGDLELSTLSQSLISKTGSSRTHNGRRRLEKHVNFFIILMILVTVANFVLFALARAETVRNADGSIEWQCPAHQTVETAFFGGCEWQRMGLPAQNVEIDGRLLTGINLERTCPGQKAIAQAEILEDQETRRVATDIYQALLRRWTTHR